MLSRIKILIPLLFLCAPTLAQNNFVIEGKMKVEDGRLDGTMEVLENGKRVRISKLEGNGKFTMELKLDKSYLFVFSQEGYVTKKIDVNTKVDANRDQTIPFAAFDFQVTLFKQYEGVSYVIFNQPVAKIFYTPELDDFDYDTDYTKSIRDQIAQVEKEVEAKKKEEEKLAREREKAEAEAFKEAQKKAEEEEKALIAAEEAARKEEERKAREEEEARKEAEKKAKEEEERLAKEKEKEEELLAATAAEEAAREKEKEEARRKEEEEREKEKERLAREEEKNKEKEEEPAKKDLPAASSNSQISRVDPPTKRKRYRPPDPPSSKKPAENVVVLHSYTVGEMGYPNLGAYGYINFGDGTGRREITKEQFDEYAKIYH